MKRRYKIVAVIILAIVVGLVINNYTKNTTFKEAVLDHMNVKEISSIEIVRASDAINEDKITITDSSQIELIMNAFSQTKLRESISPNIKYTEVYWITLKINKIRKFGIILYGKDYVVINDANPYEKYKVHSYRITNEFDSIVIQGLFK